jgi:hypothetical protein
MRRGVACTLVSLGERDRIPYGAEPDHWGAETDEPCHDCGVVPGQVHHLGCDIAQCRECGGQEHDGVC